MPLLSDAFAVMVVLPDTVEPEVGDEMDTVGGVVSPPVAVTVSVKDVV